MEMLFLHGALGTQSQFDSLLQKLGGWECYTLNFLGHGGESIPDKGFSISKFAAQVIDWMDINGKSGLPVFGYSLGGYVALYIAANHIGYFSRIFTFGSMLDFDGGKVESELQMLNPEIIEEKVPKFADILSKRHAPNDWREVVIKTAEMLRDISGNPPVSDDDFRRINIPVVLGLGDRDTTTGIEETIRIHKLIEGSSLFVMPATPHPLEKVDFDVLSIMIRKFR